MLPRLGIRTQLFITPLAKTAKKAKNESWLIDSKYLLTSPDVVNLIIKSAHTAADQIEIERICTAQLETAIQ